MKLNLEIVNRYLSAEMSAKMTNTKDNSLSLHRPEFYTLRSSFHAGALYLADAVHPELESADGVSLILTGKAAENLHTQCPTIRILDTVSLFEVANAVHRIFDTFDAWDKILLAALTKGGDLKAMFEASDHIFDNPLSLMNADYQILYLSNKEKTQTIPPSAINEGEYLPLSIVNDFKLDHLYNEVRDAKEPFLYPPEVLPMPTLCMNFFNKGEFAARIVVLGVEREIIKSDYRLLAHLGSYVGQAYQALLEDTARNQNTVHQYMKHALSGENHETQGLVDAFALEGWKQDDKYLCVKIRPSQKDTHNLTLPYNCRQIESLFEGVYAIEHNEGISVLVNLSVLDKTPDEFFQDFVYFVREGYFVIGSSRKFNDLAAFPLFAWQANIALVVGMKRDPTCWTHKFNDCILDYFLKKCTEDLPAHMVYHEDLVKLVDYDSTHSSELFVSLRNYIFNNRNAAFTAQKMFIHRMTLLYRLDKIKKLTDLQWEKTEDYLYLLISFLLYEDSTQGILSENTL